MKISGDKWKELTVEQKRPYEELCLQDKVRFERQTKELKDLGYFIMEDGSKSCDVVAKTPTKGRAGASLKKRKHTEATSESH